MDHRLQAIYYHLPKIWADDTQLSLRRPPRNYQIQGTKLLQPGSDNAYHCVSCNLLLCTGNGFHQLDGALHDGNCVAAVPMLISKAYPGGYKPKHNCYFCYMHQPQFPTALPPKAIIVQR